MKKSIKNIIIPVLALVLLVSACKKDEGSPVLKGKALLHLHHVVGNEELELNGKQYSNANGDVFTVSKFNYFISNIVFHTDSGTVYAEPESYYLIEEEKAASKMVTVDNIPAGRYVSVSFIIGVDSLRNVSGAQTGALDPASGMFWSWNTGYIMAKMEGESVGTALRFHIGGFSGTENVLKTVTLPFTQPLVVSNNTLHFHLLADLGKWFSGTHLIDFSTLNGVHMAGADAVKIADNYAGMFLLEKSETP